jgi:rhamnulokinase
MISDNFKMNPLMNRLHSSIPKIGIRPVIDGRRKGIRESLENQTIQMARTAAKFHLVGGGSQNQLLNRFTANATGRRVIAGPVEATALGNILIQAISKGRIPSIQEGRRWIGDAFSVKQFEPQNQEVWNEQYHKILAILN